MCTRTEIFDDCLKSLEQFNKNSDQFLDLNAPLCDEIRGLLKKTYDFTKNEEMNGKTTKSSALPELIVVKDFDLEQIWQQLELQNDSVLTRSLTDVSRLVVVKDSIIFKDLESKLQSEIKDAEPESEIKNEDEDDETKQQSEEEDPQEEEVNQDEVLSEDPEGEKPSEDEDSATSNNQESSTIEDKFFRLDEMEQFLKAEEKKMNDPDSGNDSENSDDSDEESVDLFQPLESKEDDEDNAMEQARYKDFFVQKDETGERKKKRVTFLEESDENGNFSEDDQDVDNAPEQKSTFEERQDRLNRKIQEMEASAIPGEKPWQLKGEITADSRPQNSLLEEVVEFDLSTRPAPIITEQTSMQLEDIIKQRVKDRVFDSVIRKARPVDIPLEFKKKLLLNQEKSKQSLAQIYEKEYLDAVEAKNPEIQEQKQEEESDLHKEIKTMMSSLFNKLDALSNFHFTPKPAVAELKIVSNLPAISMEEVAPVASSDGALLAPEEVKRRPKGDVLGKNERTDSDKKRGRRKKKLKQKIHAKHQQTKEASNQDKNRNTKKQKEDAVKNLIKNKNINKMDESSKGVKSSKAFFSQLEDQVKSQIQNKSAVKRAKSKDSSFNAKKLKL